MIIEKICYSFSTWRLHLRGEFIRSCRDIGWMRSLTARRMMRAAPATAPAELPIAAFKLQFPLGSTSRVLLEDAAGHYAGLVPTAEVFTDTGTGTRLISQLAILQDVTLSPDLPIGAIMERFDESEADDLAIADLEGRILRMLTEKYVRKRYADEIDQSQRELNGEDRVLTGCR